MTAAGPETTGVLGLERIAGDLRAAGAVQARQPPGQSRLSVLTRSPGALGINDGAITSHDTPTDANSRCSS